MHAEGSIPALKENMFFLEKKEWRRLRTPLQAEILPPRKALRYLDPLGPVMTDASAILPTIDDLADGLSRITLESIGIILFDKRIGCLEEPLPDGVREFVALIKRVFSQTQALELDPSWRQEPTDLYKKVAEDLQEMTIQAAKKVCIDLFLYLYMYVCMYVCMCVCVCVYVCMYVCMYVYVLEIRLNSLVNQVDEFLENPKDKVNSICVLAHLLDNKDLSRTELVANLASFYIAGVDTTSTALQWVCHWLSQFPEEQEILAQTLLEELKGDNLTSESLAKLPSLKHAIKEVFRLSPPAAGTMRILDHDIVLRDTVVPAGTRIFLKYKSLGTR